MPEDTDPRLDIVRTNLRLAVALRGSNYAEVARQAGLSRNALSQFISGARSMLYVNMLHISEVLDVPLGILHRPDAITGEKIRLYQLLERLPDHLARQALQEAEALAGAGRANGPA